MAQEFKSEESNHTSVAAATFGGVRVSVVQGDITRQDTDAIVNAANTMLRPGGGVDGAIQRAAGPELLAEREEARRRLGGSLPVGGAVATGAGRLPMRRIIHTAGPVWQGGSRGEAEQLASCYRSSLRVAKEEGVSSVAFPAISTGIFGYPLEEAARVAIEATRAELERDPGPLREVRFVLYGSDALEVFRKALAGCASGEA